MSSAETNGLSEFLDAEIGRCDILVDHFHDSPHEHVIGRFQGYFLDFVVTSLIAAEFNL